MADLEGSFGLNPRFSATTVFVSLQDSLNYIWRIKPKPKKEAIKFILNRLLSLAMVVSLGFLILVSLLADTLITVLHDKVFTVLPDSTYFLAQYLFPLKVTATKSTFLST